MPLLCRAENTSLIECDQLDELAAEQKPWRWAQSTQSLSQPAGCTQLACTARCLYLTVSYRDSKVAQDPRLFEYLTYYVHDTVDCHACLGKVG